MRRAAIPFATVVITLVALALAIRFTNNESWLTLWFLAFIFGGIPLFLVTLFDLGKALRNINANTQATRWAAFAFGIPEALFGLLCTVIGVAMFVTIWYKLAEEGHLGSGYGWTLVFELGPLTFIWFGVRWMRRAFSRDPPAP